MSYFRRTINEPDHKEWTARPPGKQRGTETTLTWVRGQGWQIHGFVNTAMLVEAWETVALVQQNEIDRP